MRARTSGRYVFFSHDGYGLGHVRRNVLIARALRSLDPSAEVTIVTGVPTRQAWLNSSDMHVVRVPAVLKRSDGSYQPIGMEMEEAIEIRRRRFEAVIDIARPNVVVVDRHPYGIAGELRDGLSLARSRDVRMVLGLRDILDEPEVIRGEIAGEEWEGIPELFDQVLVYGDRGFCDHQAEYGLPVEPTYCGWVTDPVEVVEREENLLAVAAGGGGDGGHVFRLALALLERRSELRGDIVAGPYGDLGSLASLTAASPARERVTLARDVDGCGSIFARASAVLEMAGYNSTFEALAARQRPILVPRRAPRREQAIRATRLEGLGLADAVEEGVDAEEVETLLDSPRALPAEALDAAGIRLDGAHRAAKHILLTPARTAA